MPPAVRREKGIKIITYNTPLAADFPASYIESNQSELGETTGGACREYIENRFNGTGKIAIIGFVSLDPETAGARVQGFRQEVTQLPGVEIVAQPPGKRLQSLGLLSGGEKSLTSLAFFFALFRYKPTPFCILDEVDAALDEANLSRFLHLMKRIKNQTQFIIITHNSKTMEVADYIYGTTMAEPNITSVFSVKMDKNKATEQ